MKRMFKYFGLVIMAIATLSGCSKELNDSEAGSTGKAMTIRCSLPDDGVRSYADGATVKWAAGDVLYVSSKGGESVAFTLKSVDETGKKAVFEAQSCPIDVGTEITACHFAQYSTRFPNGNWYYDIPLLEQYASTTFDKHLSGDSQQNLKIPMAANGILTEDMELNMQHLESMLRFKISNPTDAAMTLQSMRISANKAFEGRRYICPPSLEPIWYSQSGSKLDVSKGTTDVVIAPHSSETLDFVAVGGVTADFLFEVSVVEGNKHFKFKKSGMTTVRGTAHSFNLSLANALDAPVQLKINGGTPVDYFFGDALPTSASPITSIAVLPGATNNVLTKLMLSDLNVQLKKLSNIFSLDLSQLDFEDTKFGPSKVMGGVTNLGDFYFPKNVTTMGDTYIFENDANVKVHLTKAIKGMPLVPFAGALKSTSGIILEYSSEDADAVFKLVNGMLISKDENGKFTNLECAPEYEGVTVMNIPEGVKTTTFYATSNKRITTEIVYPSSFVSDGGYTGGYCSKLNKITIKCPRVINFSQFLISSGAAPNGVIEINTGSDQTDLEVAQAFYEKYKNSLGTWVVKTHSGVEMPLAATMSPLTQGSSYNNVW